MCVLGSHCTAPPFPLYCLPPLSTAPLALYFPPHSLLPSPLSTASLPLYCPLPSLSPLSPLYRPSVHDQESAINDKMHRMEVNHANRFQLIREAFDVPPREHDGIATETKDKIVQMAQNFSAEVTVNGTVCVCVCACVVCVVWAVCVCVHYCWLNIGV